ncbi:MAG TPA: hypothetical protein PKM73_04030 [Verrucomicrobiota bacterium]|nr:hypothetical protein [Verrucomicrobiota bacterium]HNU50982.1 hypothetical protein [Verrucomicrobiota bacterium]
MRLLSLLLALAAGFVMGRADPVIVVGIHRLAPDTDGQKVRVFVRGGGSVQGLNLNAQVADGGVAAGGQIAGPSVTAVDLITGTVFEGNAIGPDDPGSVPQLAMRTLTTASGTVVAEGLLATLTIDTTGFTSGVYRLALGATANGPTDFAGIPAAITDGWLVVGLRITSIEVEGDESILRFPTVASYTYQIESTGNAGLEPWAPLGDPVLGTGSLWTFRDPGAAGRRSRFYRVVLLDLE